MALSTKLESLSEIPVFLCYRRIDGKEEARRVFNLIENQLIKIDESHKVPVKVFFDLKLDAVSDWTKHHKPALERARSMIVIITPGITPDLSEREHPDWVHMEIKWWIENRKGIDPILIDCTGEGNRFLPAFVKEKWKNVNLVRLDLDTLNQLPEVSKQEEEKTFANRILGGIREREGLVRYRDLERLTKSEKRYRLFSIVSGILGAFLLIGLVLLASSLKQAKITSANAKAIRWVTEAESNYLLFPNRSLNLVAEALDIAPPNTESEYRSIEASFKILSSKRGECFDGISDPVASSASKNGNVMAIGGISGQLLIRRLDTKEKKLFFTDSDDSERPSAITWLSFTNNDKYLIISDPLNRGESKLWVARMVSEIENIRIEDIGLSDVEVLDLDPTGNWLVVGHSDGNVSFYELNQDNPFSTPKYKIKAHPYNLSALAWNSNGTILATGSEDGLMRLWNMREVPNLQNTIKYKHEEGEVSSLVFAQATDGLNRNPSFLFSGTGYQMVQHGGDPTYDGAMVGRNFSKLRIWLLPSEGFLTSTSIIKPARTIESNFLCITKILPSVNYEKVSLIGYKGINPNFGVWYQKKGLEIYSWKQDGMRFNFSESEPKDELANIKIQFVTDQQYLYDAVMEHNNDQLFLALVTGGIQVLSSDRNFILNNHDGIVRTFSTTNEMIISNGEDGCANIWMEDETEANIGSAIPSNQSSWTAETFEFIPGKNEIIIGHTYGSRVTLWTLNDKIRKSKLINAVNPYPKLFLDYSHFYVNGNFSNDSYIINLQNHELPVIPVPSKILDISDNGKKALINDGNELKVCLVDEMLKGRIKGSGIVKSYAPQNAIFLDREGSKFITVDREVEGPEISGNVLGGKVYSRVKWYSLEYNVWREQKSLKIPYNLALLNSKWLVLTYQDTRNQKGGEVWKLDDFINESPYFKISADYNPVDYADVISNRWLVLYHINKYTLPKNANQVHIFDLKSSDTSKNHFNFTLDGPVRSFSSNNDQLFFGTIKGTVWQFNLNNGLKNPKMFLAHDSEVSSIALSKDGKLLVTGDEKGIVRVWNLRNIDLPPLTIKTFSKEIDILKLSDDSKWIAVSAVEEAPRLYCVDPKILSSAARNAAGKPLTDEERKRFGLD